MPDPVAARTGRLRQADGQYALVEIGVVDLARIQLCLLLADRPPLRSEPRFQVPAAERTEWGIRVSLPGAVT